MTQPTDDARELSAHEDEQQFTICPHCGEDLPHHDCQNDVREHVEF
jgi:hypothetical protein